MKAIKILFVSISNATSITDISDPPLGIGYLISYALSQGITIDYRMAPSNLFDQALEQQETDLIALSAMSHAYGTALEIAGKAKAKGIPCIIGGIHITNLPVTLSNQFMAAVLGEGEKTFSELLWKFEKGKGWSTEVLSKISGVAFYDGSKLVINSPREFVANLDDLPFPVELASYRKMKRLTMVSSRGCPFRCVFCSACRFWKTVRFHSPEYIIDCMKASVSKHPEVNYVKFWDDLFSVKNNRLDSIACLKNGDKALVKIKLSVFCRVDSIDDDTIELFKSLNVVDIGIGVESGCQKTLDYMSKRYTVEQAAIALEKLARNGFHTEASYIVGFPNETVEDARETFEFIRKHQKGLYRIYPLVPLPGTPIWDIAMEKGVVCEDNSMNWERLGVTTASTNPSILLSKDFPAITQEMAQGELYSIFCEGEAQRLKSRRWIFVKLLFTQPWRLYHYILSRFRFLSTRSRAK
jgi:radical SAM superfamily enzyme YgiQ (UPF0313 family)